MDCIAQIHTIEDVGRVMNACVGPDWPQRALFGLIVLIVILGLSGVLAALLVGGRPRR